MRIGVDEASCKKGCECMAAVLGDDARKGAWSDAGKAEAGQRGRPKEGEGPAPGRAKAVKGSRPSLLKSPEDLTERRAAALERAAREDKRLYRAYLLKERLRDAFEAKGGGEARELLESRPAGACRSGAAGAREMPKRVRRHREAVARAAALGVSSARVEAANSKIKPHGAHGLRLPQSRQPHRAGYAALLEPADRATGKALDTHRNWRSLVLLQVF